MSGLRITDMVVVDTSRPGAVRLLRWSCWGKHSLQIRHKAWTE